MRIRATVSWIFSRRALVNVSAFPWTSFSVAQVAPPSSDPSTIALPPAPKVPKTWTSLWAKSGASSTSAETSSPVKVSGANVNLLTPPMMLDDVPVMVAIYPPGLVEAAPVLYPDGVVAADEGEPGPDHRDVRRRDRVGREVAVLDAAVLVARGAAVRGREVDVDGLVLVEELAADDEGVLDGV